MIFGYARVSTTAQDLADQLDPLKDGAQEADLAHTDGVSWTTIHREQQRAGL